MATVGPDGPGGDPSSAAASRWGRVDPLVYDAQWARMERSGQSPHGEADFVFRFSPARVLDAGCGTGRVAVELARRGCETVGVDLDSSMIEAARVKAPALRWVEGDLAQLDLGETFDVVVAAGNVMIFVAPGTEAAVVACLAAHLAPSGVLVVGFQLQRGLSLPSYDAMADRAGLSLIERWSTWDGHAFADASSGYAVSVHSNGPATRMG